MNTEKQSDLTRRAFCRCAGSAISLSALAGGAGALLAGCASPTSPSGGTALPVVNGTSSGRTVSITVDASSPVATVGGMAITQTPLGVFLVGRTSQTTFSALSSVCSHQGCTVSGYSGNQYICPCHGASFNTNGQVTGGPAPTGLVLYPSQFANNVLTFTV